MHPRLAHIPDWERLAKEARFQPSIMAALCPISLRQMERFFVRRFHQTPNEWARQLRCRLARQLIAEGWSSKAIVAELAFAGGSHLGREFRRFYGASPQTFAPLYGNPRRNVPAFSQRHLATTRRRLPKTNSAEHVAIMP